MTVKNSNVAYLFHFCVVYSMNVWLYHNYEFLILFYEL